MKEIEFVYTYCPESCPKYKFREVYCHKIGEIASRLLGGKYLGEYVLQKNLPVENSFWIPHCQISIEEARKLKITGNLYGYWGPRVFTMKAILHLPVSEYQYIPENFPIKFSRKVSELGLIAPGYSVFTVADAIKAFGILRSEGFIVRFKPSLGTGGIGQTIISSLDELLKAVDKIDMNDFRKYGAVLESQLINSDEPGSEVRAYSGGIIKIGENRYSYVGEQSFQQFYKTPEYCGTDLILGKMEPNELGKRLKVINPLYEEILAKLSLLEKATHELKHATITRMNFDFLVGNLPGQLGGKMFLVDQGFGFGDATLPEFLAIDDLLDNPQKDLSRAECKFQRGSTASDKIPETASIIHRYKRPTPDRQDRTGEMQYKIYTLWARKKEVFV